MDILMAEQQQFLAPFCECRNSPPFIQCCGLFYSNFKTLKVPGVGYECLTAQ